MEQFSVDRSFYDISANDLKEFWDSDIDPSACDFKVTDDDWNQGGPVSVKSQVILHDRLMTDAALGVTPIKTEHSYCSLSSDHSSSMSPQTKGEEEDEEDECLLPAIAPKNATGHCNAPPVSVVFVKTEPMSAPTSPAPDNRSAVLTSANFIPTKSTIIERKREQKTYGQSILKQPSVTLTTKHAVKRKQGSSSVIKIEHSSSTGFSLPPTPPSSTSSDSEGNVSPQHSSSPTRRLFISSANSIRQPIQTPLISSQPKGSTGTLLLTEEEKRTLLAEGYPIPVRLPLTKAEEKSLKKIRRKIKNKISAQESRRKKKEYMDALEKKVQILSSENSEYKKKLSALEDNNTSLVKELSKLRSIIASYQGTGNLLRGSHK